MILSLDVGGSKISAGLVKGNQVFCFQKIDWQKPLTAQKIIDQISKIISNFLDRDSRIRAIALGVAGQGNKNGEVFITRHLLPQKTKIAIKKILEKKFKLPVYVDNDVHCFALAEAVLGQGKNKKIVVGLTLGSGIGGGIIIDGKIFQGKDGMAGEFGHMVIDPSGPICSCGKRGCFEALVSVTALKRNYYQLTNKKTFGLMIYRAFKNGDKKAIQAAEKLVDYLALGLGNIIDVLNPDLIILGGGLSNFKEIMDQAIKKSHHWTLGHGHQTKILISHLGDKAQLLGASLLASKKLNK